MTTCNLVIFDKAKKCQHSEYNRTWLSKVTNPLKKNEICFLSRFEKELCNLNSELKSTRSRLILTVRHQINDNSYPLDKREQALISFSSQVVTSRGPLWMNDKKYNKKIVLHITEFPSVSERSLSIVNVTMILAMQFFTGITRVTQLTS